MMGFKQINRTPGLVSTLTLPQGSKDLHYIVRPPGSGFQLFKIVDHRHSTGVLDVSNIVSKVLKYQPVSHGSSLWI